MPLEVELIGEDGLNAWTGRGVPADPDVRQRLTRGRGRIAEIRSSEVVVEVVDADAGRVRDRKILIEFMPRPHRGDVDIRLEIVRKQSVIEIARDRRGSAVHERDADVR